MHIPSISFLVICKDNYSEFLRTFNSIYSQMYSHDEIYVVDSSITKNIRDFLSSYVTSESNIVYKQIPPKGVYDAKLLPFKC